MRILIHAANLATGGGLSIGKELLRAWMKKKDSVLVLASPPIAAFLEEEQAPENWQWEIIAQSPGKTLSAQHFFRKKAALAVQSFQPDVVFTVFGPPLWKPPVPHLCGFANGLYFPKNPVLPFDEKSDLRQKVRHRLRRYLVFRSMKKDTDAIWTETDAARQKLLALVGKKEIFVVPNELSDAFKNTLFEGKAPPKEKWKVLLLTADYPHKNFSLLAAISPFPEIEKDFIFQITLPDATFRRFFEDTSAVQNLGPVSGKELLDAYRNADLIFCPSVAEIFSATWLEAMAAKRPLLCTDIPEARQICGNAALYFDGYHPESAVSALCRITTDENLRKNLVERGTSRLHELTPEESRAEKLYQILRSLSNC